MPERLKNGPVAAGLSAVCVLVLIVAVARAEEPHNAFDFEAVGLEGRTFSGLSLRGRVVLLDFWATWCGPCVKAIPTLNQLRNEFKSRGFEVVGVASYSGTVEDVREFVARLEPHYPIVVGDEDLVERFQVIGYPTYFLVNRGGKIVDTFVGEIESVREEVTAKIRQLTRSTPPLPERRTP
ncbi:MAG: TlpA disulfide reductase family protein [Acidobacteriota bacterium]